MDIDNPNLNGLNVTLDPKNSDKGPFLGVIGIYTLNLFIHLNAE